MFTELSDDQIEEVFIYYNKKTSKYDQELPQSHNADQPTAPRGRVKEH